MDQYSAEGKSDFQAIDTQGLISPKIDIPRGLRFERINEITWKLTNGEMTNVGASHGQWGGYRVTKAVGWVIDIGITKPAWIARYRDQTTNPMSLAKAKSAAMAMARNKCGDYYVSKPIAHLNGLAGRLADLNA